MIFIFIFLNLILSLAPAPLLQETLTILNQYENASEEEELASSPSINNLSRFQLKSEIMLEDISTLRKNQEEQDFFYLREVSENSLSEEPYCFNLRNRLKRLKYRLLQRIRHLSRRRNDETSHMTVTNFEWNSALDKRNLSGNQYNFCMTEEKIGKGADEKLSVQYSSPENESDDDSIESITSLKSSQMRVTAEVTDSFVEERENNIEQKSDEEEINSNEDKIFEKDPSFLPKNPSIQNLSYSSCLLGRQIFTFSPLEGVNQDVIIQEAQRTALKLTQKELLININQWSIVLIPNERTKKKLESQEEVSVCWNEVHFDTPVLKDSYDYRNSRGTIYIYFDEALLSEWKKEESGSDCFEFFILLELIQAQMKIMDGLAHLNPDSSLRWKLELASWVKTLLLSSRYIFSKKENQSSVQDVYQQLRSFLWSQERKKKGQPPPSQEELQLTYNDFSEDSLLYILSLMEYVNEDLFSFEDIDSLEPESLSTLYEKIERKLTPPKAKQLIEQIKTAYSA